MGIQLSKEHTFQCSQCHQEYIQTIEKEDLWHRDLDFSVCPYCGVVLAVSRSFVFYNKRK